MSKRPFVSFAEVKQKVSVPDVLAAFGVLDRFRCRGDVVTGVCPLPAHKHGPSPNPDQWRADCRKGVWQWYCFGDCQRGGDVVELVKALTGYDNAHVRFWFAERFGDRLSGNRDGPKTTKPEPAGKRVESDAACEPPPLAESPQAASATTRNLPVASAELKPLRFRLNLDPDVPYLRDRGVLPETIARYGLGLCRKGVLKDYVAIPVYRWPREAGENPVAYLGRWPGDDYDEAAGRPRYKWPDGFAKSQVVYGLAEAKTGEDADREGAASKDRSPSGGLHKRRAGRSHAADTRFSGGEMVILDDRVELCGITILVAKGKGRRKSRAHKVLEQLRLKEPSGIYRSFSGGELAAAIRVDRGQNAIAECIRDFRASVTEMLREQRGLDCGPQDVIQSGGSGYRLNEWINVSSPPEEFTGSSVGANDPVTGPVKRARDPVNDPVAEEAGGTVAPEKRSNWIMVQLTAGRKLRAPKIAQELKCSVKTAKRELNALKAQGRIEFVGAPRTGYYRLKK